MNLLVIKPYFTTVEKEILYGTYDREAELYRYFIKSNKYSNIYVIDGTKARSQISPYDKLADYRLLNLSVYVSGGYFLPSFLRQLYVAYKARAYIGKCSIIKADQTIASAVTYILSVFFGKPFYIRTGFSFSLFMWNKRALLKCTAALLMERIFFPRACFVTCSTEEALTHAKKTARAGVFYKLANYVPDRYFDEPILGAVFSACFVGRFEPQKNLVALCNAINAFSGLEVHFYGSGSLQPLIAELGRVKNCIKVFNAVTTNELPALYSKYKFCFLVSHFEGFPKTLLEAMSRGCVPIVTNVQGINEIANESNAIIARSPDCAEIFLAIQSAMKLRIHEYDRLSSEGIKTARSLCSVASVGSKEFSMARVFL